VRREILKLHNQGLHEHVIAALEAALINGQSQPWMYEVLALSMEIQKYPKEEVERVVLSMTDFGGADFGSMMYSAAYLVRFGRIETALKLFRQASRIAPERSEPYVLALEHAQKLASAEDITWAACGILLYDWSKEHVQRHRDARDALGNLERSLMKDQDSARLEKLHQRQAEALERDVVVHLEWNGTADLDLEVEEPYGSVCNFAEPQTIGGGFHLRDGFGPKPDDCQEKYVCPIGAAGDYRIRIKQAWGQLVGRRATLTITTHKGSPAEHVEKKTLVLEKGTAAVVATLQDGRRRGPRAVPTATALSKLLPGRMRPVRRPMRDENVARALAEFGRSRGALVGAVGFQPIVQVIPEGAIMGASAVISADRRYVRIGVNPVFNNITDVFTFSFFGGSGNGNAQGNGGAQPAGNR
jgi:hypothetical protein